MADAAFALSPISAQPASPTDADFEAISEAFMETTRGRWFLAEFARRNRNADTAMVLDAVARIERSLAAQKEQQAQQAPPPEPSTALPEALAAVKTILAAARDRADTVLSDPSADLGLVAARKCARVIREIAWGLRESGADGRICTLLESQVEAINAACDQVSAAGLRDGVLQAFDDAAQRIAALAPAPQVSETPADLSDDDLFETTAPESAEAEAEPIAAQVPDRTEAAIVEAAVMSDAAELAATVETEAEPMMAAAPEPAFEMPQPASLGATLIASGIVARPVAPRIDLLAPLRRMSLAERVAFFS